MRYISWTDAQLEALRRGRADGKTYATIAAELGEPFTARKVEEKARRLVIVGRIVSPTLHQCAAPDCTKMIPYDGKGQKAYDTRKTCSTACQFALARSRRVVAPPRPAPDARTAEAMIAQFLATKGVTRCPARYAAVTPNAALTGKAAATVIAKIRPPPQRDWKGLTPTQNEARRLPPAAIS